MHVEGDQGSIVGRAKREASVRGRIMVAEVGSIGLVEHEGVVAEADLLTQSIHALNGHELLEGHCGCVP